MKFNEISNKKILFFSVIIAVINFENLESGGDFQHSVGSYSPNYFAPTGDCYYYVIQHLLIESIY